MVDVNISVCSLLQEYIEVPPKPWYLSTIKYGVTFQIRTVISIE